MFNIVVSFDKCNLNPLLDCLGREDRNLFFTGKPVDRNILDFLGRLIRNQEKSEVKIYASRFSEIEVFDINDIYYFESFGNLKCINSKNESFEFYGTLAQIEKATENLGFVRINNSYIISLKHIKKANARSVQMDNDKTINVGRKYTGKYRTAVYNVFGCSCLNRNND